MNTSDPPFFDILEEVTKTMIHIDGDRMRWILAKFLKDSLNFLSRSPRERGTKRRDWVNQWQKENLTPQAMKKWIEEE
jgi:hypothetical protein